MVNILLLLIVCSCLILFVILLRGLKVNKWEKYDTYVFKKFEATRNKRNNIFFKGITLFGSAPFIVPEILICMFFLNGRHRVLLLTVMIFEELLNLLIKWLVKRDRPKVEHLTVETSYSFPSGHTMASVCFYGLLLYMVLNSTLLISWIVGLSIILVGMIVLIPCSRIYLGVHHLSDILAACCLSISILIIFISLYNLGIII